MRDAWKDLRPMERMATVDAVRAGYRAGTIDTEAVFSALPKIAADPSRSVAFALVPDLETMRDYVARADDAPKLSREVEKIYAPLFKTAGWEPKAKNDTPVLRHDALQAATLVGKDAALRKEAVRRSRRWLGIEGAADARALAPEIVEVALTIAVEDGGAEIWDALAKRLAGTDDALARRQLLIALMRTPDPALAARARKMVLDGTVRTSEVYRALATLMSVASLRESTWQWFAANVDAVIARAPESFAGYFPSLAEHLCDDRRENDVRRVFGPRLDKLVGARRELENTLERNRVCSAIRAGQDAATSRFLGARTSPPTLGR
jgi:alanyl aminopeptidase